MTQTAIDYFFMRGGSSRGPYFKRDDLPESREALAEILIAAIGSGHALNIDGIGGGNAVTTKVAMLSVSDDEWADIDYFFAQVSVETKQVDFKPTCGNILTAVGPAAIEMGLIEAQADVTNVKIRAVNTGAKILSRVQTPDHQVTYEGDDAIDGVPGTAAPVELHFMEVAGSSTGQFLPTGQLIDNINGIEVTCMDVAMPMVIARAEDFGLTGHETREELDQNRAFFEKMEAVRLEAGKRMGMGDVSASVTPKFGLLAPCDQEGHIISRYFMPWDTPPTMAVTGSPCLSSCALMAGTIADGMMTHDGSSPVNVSLHHPMGVMDVLVDYDIIEGQFHHKSAGLKRTARKLAQGQIFIPSSIWRG